MDKRLTTPETTVDINDVEAIYRLHGRRCYTLALRLVRDRQLAQDVVQDVLTAVHRFPDRFDPARGSLATWLMTLTHHKAVDLVRARRSRTELDTPLDDASDVADVQASPEEQAGVNDEHQRIRAALSALPRNEREVIVLAYFEGYTQRQIADKTAVPLGTVKSRTLRALRRLQAATAPDGRLRPAVRAPSEFPFEAG